jgi:hypothetical protein
MLFVARLRRAQAVRSRRNGGEIAISKVEERIIVHHIAR